LSVPRGYVSGTFLSDRATYSGATLATLGVTPGTYKWTWGTGANQNFTLQIKIPGPARTAIWYLNNNAFVSGAYGPTLPAGWKVVGVADFDGDGRPDYLLSASNQTAIWYLSGTTFVRGAYGPSLPNSLVDDWNLVAVGDFNADGKP